jgi:hypothetical protein
MGSIFGKAKRGFGKALKPRGPGVIRPKPTDRYGQQMKPKAIRPGKKDGGKVKKFPDLTGDGKVTRADVLKGRGVFAAGGKVKDKGAFETESRRQKQKQRKRIKRIGESLRKISPLPLPKLNKKDK